MGVTAPGVVEFDAKRIAAALGEQLEHVPLRVVTPDRLAEEVGGRQI